MPPFVGQILLLPYTFEPQGWIFCDGRLLPIAEFEPLFSLLGNNFGGDGESTFGLPDLRAIAPDNCQYCISFEGYMGPNVNQLVLGQTMISPFSLNTQGILECAGQSLQTAQYMPLESLMGTRFGGDGTNNFNLPDLRSIAPAKCSYVMDVVGIVPSSQIPGVFLGELLLLPYEVQSSRALQLCNGQLLQITQNTALFSILGNRFGGDGKQTFALPNLGAAAPAKFNYYISVQGIFPPRS
ncbi:MAG: tail fiber protein [Acidobacteriota bacterium]|nr:tail fiber protein [Acidobacteriota bacterium]